MQNQILNATGLDGTADWASDFGVLSTDDVLVGRDGVIVNAATRLAAARGARVALMTSSVPVVIGQPLEAFIHFAAAGGRASLELEFVTGGGGHLGGRQILPLRPKAITPRRGIPSDFNIAYTRVRAQSTGFARLRVVATAFGGADLAAYAMRPFLDAGPLPDRRQFWGAGSHSNPDLVLPTWPTNLPGVNGSYQADPLGRRKGFSGDSLVPMFRQVSTTSRWLGRGSYSLNTRERDVLEAFFEETSGPFYFVRPDTFQLCRAAWTDKSPSDSGVGGDRVTEVELLLEVA